MSNKNLGIGNTGGGAIQKECSAEKARYARWRKWCRREREDSN